MLLSEMKRRLQGLNVAQVAEETIEETKQAFIDLNTAQMYKGLDNTGQPIHPAYRSPKYARVKHEMNPLPGLGIPDAHVTGAFYRGYTLMAQGGKVTENSTVPYADELSEKYPEMWGLDPENLVTYRTGPFWSVLKNKVETQLFL